MIICYLRQRARVFESQNRIRNVCIKLKKKKKKCSSKNRKRECICPEKTTRESMPSLHITVDCGKKSVEIGRESSHPRQHHLRTRLYSICRQTRPYCSSHSNLLHTNTRDEGWSNIRRSRNSIFGERVAGRGSANAKMRRPIKTASGRLCLNNPNSIAAQQWDFFDFFFFHLPRCSVMRLLC